MGIENTLFATCCNNLGLTYKKMQKVVEAESYYRKFFLKLDV
jgi:hypothetical protein